MSDQSITADGNTLVIYYDNVVPEVGPSVTVDEFTLVSAVSDVTTLEKVEKVTEIAHKIGEVVKAGKAPAPEFKQDIVLKIEIDTTNVSEFRHTIVNENDWNPYKETTTETYEDKNTKTVITTTTTHYPFMDETKETHKETINKTPDSTVASNPVNVDKSAGTKDGGTTDGGTTDGGTTDGGTTITPGTDLKDQKVITPVDESWVDDELTDLFLGVINSFSTKKFSEDSGAEAYLDYALKKAGLEIRTTSTGITLVDSGPEDPAGVESQLRQRGIHDDAFIAIVRTEVNDVIKRFEDTIETVQASFSGLDPDDAATWASPNSTFHEEFDRLAHQWNEELVSEFSIGSPYSIEITLPSSAEDIPSNVSSDISSNLPSNIPFSTWDVINGVVTMTAPYVSKPAPKRISPTGLSIRAGLGAFDSASPAVDAEPGFYATPIISVFDDDAWKLIA